MHLEPVSKVINAKSAESGKYQLSLALASCLGIVLAAVAPAGNFPWFDSLLRVLPQLRNSSAVTVQLFSEVSEDLLSRDW